MFVTERRDPPPRRFRQTHLEPNSENSDQHVDVRLLKIIQIRCMSRRNFLRAYPFFFFFFFLSLFTFSFEVNLEFMDPLAIRMAPYSHRTVVVNAVFFLVFFWRYALDDMI